MALLSRYSGLVRQYLLFNELGFNSYYKKNGLQKLLYNFESDPTVGLKFMALFSCYSGLARQYLLFNELGFVRYYKENGLRKLL